VSPFGYLRDELLGLPIEISIPAQAREHHRENRMSYFAHPNPWPMGAGQDLPQVTTGDTRDRNK
jgi:hypothetical protein